MRVRSLVLGSVVASALAFVPCLAGQYPGARPVPAAWKPGFQAITEREARSLVTFLAGPNFNGRNPFTADFAAAAGFAAGYMKDLGLVPAGDSGGYMQRFTLDRVDVIPDSTWLSSADGALHLGISADFSIGAGFDFEDQPDIVFVRAGTGPFAADSAALAGKWVVVAPTMVDRRDALLAIIAAGPRFLIVPRPAVGLPATFTVPGGVRDPRTRGYGQPSLSIDGARQLAQACGATSWLDPAAQPAMEPCRQAITVRGKVRVTASFPTMNVIGRIEGSDSTLRDEAVVIGAHLDHLGRTDEGMHYGADDNASGSTAALLVAKAVMANPVKPKRTVIVALWSGEELGTLGSLYYSRHPVVPMDRTVAYLNMDMVGRDEDDPRFNERPENNRQGIYFGIVRLNSQDLYELLIQANAYVGLTEKADHEDRTERSDTRNFVYYKVPTLKAFTGEHADYHETGDTPDKVNTVKLANVARWIYLATEELARRPDKPRFERKPFVPPS